MVCFKRVFLVAKQQSRFSASTLNLVANETETCTKHPKCYLHDEQGQRIGKVELYWVLAAEDVAFLYRGCCLSYMSV